MENGSSSTLNEATTVSKTGPPNPCAFAVQWVRLDYSLSTFSPHDSPNRYWGFCLGRRNRVLGRHPLQPRLSPRGVPKVKDFNYLALFVNSIINPDRRMQQFAHSPPLVDRLADMRESAKSSV